MNNVSYTQSITPRDTRSFRDFLAEARNYPMLNADEEAALCYRAKAGDIDARNKLVTSNLLFVVRVAKEYANYDLPFEDLVSAGIMGLLHSAEIFDPSVGVRFLSYSVHTIRTYITKALSDYSRTVRLPLNVISRLSKIRKAADRFIIENGRYPSDEELAAEVGLLPEEVSADTLMDSRSFSISAPLTSDESDTTFEDVMSSTASTDDALMTESLSIDLDRSLKTLGERDAAIMRDLFGISGERLTVDEVAGKWGLSRERVRQIQRDSLAYLRHHCRDLLFKYTA